MYIADPFSLAVKYGFAKPNDHRALDLMNAAAIAVLKEIPDISLAYGISDEFRFVGESLSSDIFWINLPRSFIYDRSSNLFDRRERYSILPLNRMTRAMLTTARQQDPDNGGLNLHFLLCRPLALAFFR